MNLLQFGRGWGWQLGGLWFRVPKKKLSITWKRKLDIKYAPELTQGSWHGYRVMVQGLGFQAKNFPAVIHGIGIFPAWSLDNP